MATLNSGKSFLFDPTKMGVRVSTTGTARVMIVFYNPKTPPMEDNPQGIRSVNVVLADGNRTQSVQKDPGEDGLAIFVKNYGPDVITAAI